MKIEEYKMLYVIKKNINEIEKEINNIKKNNVEFSTSLELYKNLMANLILEYHNICKEIYS